ncbi:hypothetical protein AV654_19560 [Paenibacillus elgii]|uniref:Type II secretion system protein GspF domain-containing protein n=1 Tax=Paenibacillus elgii TaxID=189691 RepID=A0A161SCM0_9BACL|nr:hypothetical protein [Paenibacillus elgii]KZE78175.1 hypothetical protein AV654_19560 [Paenibacillus elgii]
MKDILYIAIVVMVVLLVWMAIQSLREALLPGFRRFQRRSQGKDDQSSLSLSERYEHWLKKNLPESAYKWIENLLYQTGQSYNWTVGKAVRSITVSFLIGFLFFFFDLLLFLAANSPNRYLLLVVGFLVLVTAPWIPIIKFKSERRDFVSRIIYQTPQYIDILESELVYGQGSIESSFEAAKNELDGELKLIMDEAHKHVLVERSVRGALDDIIKTRINHKLYDQIVVALHQYSVTNKAEKMMKSLHMSAKTAVNETIRKQTSQKNLTITVVSIGILINLTLLVGVPLLLNMLGMAVIG